jgi:arylsulfatase
MGRFLSFQSAILCFLFLILFAAAVGCAKPKPEKSNFVLITVDTLRADHLGIYGYKRATSPNLDTLAKEGTWFRNCYSQSATTGASHVSLFTSRYPQSHGVLANREKFPDFASIMDAFRTAGYSTAGFVSSAVLAGDFGINKKFDHFDENLNRAEKNRANRYERTAKDTLLAVQKWIEATKAPFFIWIHLIDPHGPYQAPENADYFVTDALYKKEGPILEFAASNWEFNKIPLYQRLDNKKEADFYIARYDAEIRYTDEALGIFFNFLKNKNIYEDTAIAITADHGETMAEPNHLRHFSHSTIAYEEVVRVPLILKGTNLVNFAKLDSSKTIRLMDIFPTVCSLFGLKKPSGLQGVDFTNTDQPGNVFSFGAYGTEFLEKKIGTQFTILDGDFRYLVRTDNSAEELYDHKNDPAERVNVADNHPEKVAQFRKELKTFFEKVPKAESQSMHISEEQAEKLKALGYTHQ